MFKQYQKVFCAIGIGALLSLASSWELSAEENPGDQLKQPPVSNEVIKKKTAVKKTKPVAKKRKPLPEGKVSADQVSKPTVKKSRPRVNKSNSPQRRVRPKVNVPESARKQRNPGARRSQKLKKSARKPARVEDDVLEKGEILENDDALESDSNKDYETDDFEISGLVMDSTVTKAGRDFYDFFNTFWQAPDGLSFTINISERADGFRGSYIWVYVDERIVFQGALNPRSDLIEGNAQNAAKRARSFIINRKNTADQLELY